MGSALLVLAATPAWAHLGGTTELLASEKAALHIQATQVEHRPLYDVHHLVRADGEIRQYSDAAGNIFAVSWKTQAPVRLADLLEVGAVVSSSTPQLRSSSSAPPMRHTVTFASGDRVVQVLKLAHLNMGTAWLTSRVPPGVDVKELK